MCTLPLPERPPPLLLDMPYYPVAPVHLEEFLTEARPDYCLISFSS